MKSKPNAAFVLNIAAKRLANNESFKEVCDSICHCRYINLEAVANHLSDAVDAFATRIDYCSKEELTDLISRTDPRVVCLAAYRITYLMEFMEALSDASIPFDLHYPEEYPVRSALIDLWRSYCHIIE